MTYDHSVFLANHPVFRREELAYALGAARTPADSVAERRLNNLLTGLRRQGEVQSVRNGLWASRSVMEEMPEWLPYAIASRITEDSVISHQAALNLHLRQEAPARIHVYTSHLEDEVPVPSKGGLPKWRIVPIHAGHAPARKTGPCSPQQIVEYLGHFEGWKHSLLATSLERTLLDILDGAHGRPRKAMANAEAPREGITSGDQGGVPPNLKLWPSPMLEESWKVLQDADLNFSLEEVCQLLEKHPRATQLRAKAGFFLWLNRDRLGLTAADLVRLRDRPEKPIRWAHGLDDFLVQKWGIFVPKGMEKDYRSANKGEDRSGSRLRPGIQADAPGLRQELVRRFGKFGINGFYDCQEELAIAVLHGRDAIAILPTGAGKSLTFQFPSALLEGPTIVISPLISLIADQVREARAKGLVAYSYQGMGNARVWKDIAIALEEGILNLLFVSPESWPSMLDTWPELRDRVAQIVVDEAHLINSWGQDFRFNYDKLGGLRQRLPQVPILALTATATPEGRQRIMEKLQFNQDAVIRKLPAKRHSLFLHRFKTQGDASSKYKVR